MTAMQETPGANRLHIGLFGRTNSGKSSLLNAIAGQQVSIVSELPGTTTDPVTRAMELLPLGPCLLIDTAGFGDESALGESRTEKTRLAAEKADLALILIEPGGDVREKLRLLRQAGGTRESAWEAVFPEESAWRRLFLKKQTPVLFVISKADVCAQAEELAEAVREVTGAEALCVSARTGEGMERLKEALIRLMPEEAGQRTITGDLAGEGDLVLLVMPQDLQAPKGRLILPQVQTIRELLDKRCEVFCVTTGQLPQALSLLKQPPRLIITDSQVFGQVAAYLPRESRLTSFSVLFAACKGDISYYMEGVRALGRLSGASRVLIAECCTHAPLSEDIGREKIPRLLRKRFGAQMEIRVVSGTDFPQDLTDYDLIIQCGACMYNRKYVLSRIDRARTQGVPMTNYGVALAYLNGILDQIAIPGEETEHAAKEYTEKRGGTGAACTGELPGRDSGDGDGL